MVEIRVRLLGNALCTPFADRSTNIYTADAERRLRDALPESVSKLVYELFAARDKHEQLELDYDLRIREALRKM